MRKLLQLSFARFLIESGLDHFNLFIAHELNLFMSFRMKLQMKCFLFLPNDRTFLCLPLAEQTLWNSKGWQSSFHFIFSVHDEILRVHRNKSKLNQNLIFLISFFFRIQLKAKNRWKTFTHRNLFQIENWNGKNSFISSLFALSWDKTSSASLPLGVVEHFWLFSWFGIWMILFFSHVSDEFSNEWEDKFVE